MVEMTRQDFVARHSGVQLAGSVWLPDTPARAAVLMYPGSGATDRDNGSYFPPVRSHLLARGFAVCSFDRRGVGGSSGRWQDADIIEQVGDVTAVARLVTREGLISRPLVVPVGASVMALRGSVQADLLNVRVFADADHRIQDHGASFAGGYLDTISAFVETASPECA